MLQDQLGLTSSHSSDCCILSATPICCKWSMCHWMVMEHNNAEVASSAPVWLFSFPSKLLFSIEYWLIHQTASYRWEKPEHPLIKFLHLYISLEPALNLLRLMNLVFSIWWHGAVAKASPSPCGMHRKVWEMSAIQSVPEPDKLLRKPKHVSI